MAGYRWKAQQDAVLREHAAEPLERLHELLPERSVQAIYSRLRALGIDHPDERTFWRGAGEWKPTVADKQCRTCKLKKPADQFPRRTRSPDGLDDYCRECKRARQRKFYDSNPTRRFEYWRKHRLSMYGLTQEAFDALWEAQAGRCPICSRELDGGDRAPHIDHAHDETRRVRGIVCDRCNRGMGEFGDDPELLESAARYLRTR